MSITTSGWESKYDIDPTTGTLIDKTMGKPREYAGWFDTKPGSRFCRAAVP